MAKWKVIVITSVVIILILVGLMVISNHSVKKETASMTKTVKNEAVQLKDTTNSSKTQLEFVTNHLPKELGMVDLDLGTSTDDPQVMPLSLLRTGLLEKDIDAFISAFTVENVDSLLKGYDFVEDRQKALHNAISRMTRNDTLTELEVRKIKEAEYILIFHFENTNTYKHNVQLEQNNNPGVDMSYRIQTPIKELLKGLDENE
ncbi:hypothetical protein [Rummeliibacillus stabekisii]|uniref:hypothetical protein n=1 Tax=Rummeliibacillus stabekisii TaxID=241244 RepID=UPI001172723D|nr:hypothetical protein [Rummeliibacillus stabekisii]MBB5171555.1 hypothetical protein [Rummeliibacillus stabekisii]GEL05523.1 hypothetical protein RST01_21500 [Rummeliibacillus stabekisii]